MSTHKKLRKPWLREGERPNTSAEGRKKGQLAASRAHPSLGSLSQSLFVEDSFMRSYSSSSKRCRVYPEGWSEGRKEREERWDASRQDEKEMENASSKRGAKKMYEKKDESETDW